MREVQQERGHNGRKQLLRLTEKRSFKKEKKAKREKKASARNVSCHCVKYQEGKKRGMGKGKGERAERKEKERLLGKQLK